MTAISPLMSQAGRAHSVTDSTGSRMTEVFLLGGRQTDSDYTDERSGRVCLDGSQWRLPVCSFRARLQHTTADGDQAWKLAVFSIELFHTHTITL
jgi:hypothetical protein